MSGIIRFVFSIGSFLILAQLSFAAVSDTDYQAQMQNILLRMVMLSPHGSMDPKLFSNDDKTALEKAKKQLGQIDYLLEDVDDAFTVGDFTKAATLLAEIEKTPNLNGEQINRMQSYTLAMNTENSSKAIPQVGEPQKPLVKNFPRQVLHKHDPWMDVLTYGGITVGVAAVGVGVYLLTK